VYSGIIEMTKNQRLEGIHSLIPQEVIELNPDKLDWTDKDMVKGLVIKMMNVIENLAQYGLRLEDEIQILKGGKPKKRTSPRDALMEEIENEFLKEFEILEMINEARILRNKIGDPDSTIDTCEKILKLSPDNRDALLLKAGALGELGRFEEEADVLAKILELYPDNHEVYYLYALRSFSLGRNNEALRYIDMSLERYETFSNVITKAQILHLMGDEDYKKYLKKAEQIDKKRLNNFMKNCWTPKAEYDVEIIPRG